MKRYILLAAVLVCLPIWGGIVWYFRDTQEPEPTPPVPAPSAEIIGPESVKAGELVVYTTSDRVKFTRWTTVPDGPQIKVTNSGQVLVSVFDTAGEYHIVLASGSGNGVDIAKVKVRVDGEGPDPPRPPPLPPSPDVPDSTGWEKWAKDAVLKIKYSGLKADVVELAGQLSSYAAQIAAGAVKDVRTARVRIRQITNSTFGENTPHWLEFSKEYAERTKGFSGLPEYQAALAAMAVGLESAVDFIKEPARATNPYDAAIEKSRADKRPVMVVITSQGCPPCERLKIEWLPNSKAYGNTRVVMLDRTLHREVVETVGLRGMQGRIKVPQVHILRYVDGTWQQFGRVGYTNYSSMDRWVRSVFTWENKS